MALAPGSTVGPYRILEQLGRGGMATVHKAYEAALDRDVALKVLPAEFLHDETFAERFQREAKVVARLEHPNIVPIHAFGIEGGVPWMAMRLVPGGTLSALIKKQRLEASRVVAILRGVAEALDYAHAKGIVHRDVKPQNVLLDEHERVYLADFGISRMVEGSSALTATGMISGTPHYMSPEQATGKKVDHRADLYALGIVAYEMLTGRVPFAADTPVAVLLKHVTEPLPLPSTMDFPEPAVRAILKCVAKSATDRWPSGRAFVDALAAGLEGVELAAGASSEGTLTIGPDVLETATGYSAVPGGIASRPTPAAPPARPRSGVAWMTAAAALGVAGLTAAAAIGWFALRRPASPGPPDRAAGPALERPSGGESKGTPEGREEEAPPRRAPVAPAIPVGTDAVAPDAALPAKLAIDFEHGIKNGSLRVIVGDQPVLVERLAGTAKKKLVAFKGWKGSVDEVVDVPPGSHQVRVQVAWDDNIKSASIRGQFTPGVTRHLEIRLGGLKKNLSLEWK
jgi:hypothetical protein